MSVDDKMEVDGGFISDESSFYGDEDTRAACEAKVSAFSPRDYYSIKRIDLNALASSSRRKAAGAGPSAAAPLVNPDDEGNAAACKQPDETAAEFVARLPPRSTSEASVGPWIWAHRPHSKQAANDAAGAEDYAGLGVRGAQILADLAAQRRELEAAEPGETRAGIARRMAPQRDTATEAIYRAARDARVTSGKWMLFPPVEEVDAVWTAVVEAVVAGELGNTAKVASAPAAAATTGAVDVLVDGNGRSARPRLVCVYTEDAFDRADVGRVLVALRRRRLVPPASLIYYKADALTVLGLNSGNEWGIPASLYSSSDFAKP